MGSSKSNIANMLIWWIIVIALFYCFVCSAGMAGKESTLGGAIERPNLPQLNFTNFLSGKIQKKSDIILSQNFLYHDELVRLHNQWDFDKWNHLNARSVVMGSDGYLFEQNYIDNLNGKHYKEKANYFEHNSKNIAKVHSEFEKRDKRLVFLMMPSKSFVHPDKIPSNQKHPIPDKHIHDDFISFANKEGIHMIDFKSYFESIQDTFSYPIFSKHGIHLSEYAESYVLDSILNYLEAYTEKDLFDYTFTPLATGPIPRGRDNDIAQALNLITPLPNDEVLAYQELSVTRVDNINTPNSLLIGDSFYWGLYGKFLYNKLFGKHEFWYRNFGRFYLDIAKSEYSNPELCLASMDNFDLVFILITHTEIELAGWGYFKNIVEEMEKIDGVN